MHREVFVHTIGFKALSPPYQQEKKIKKEIWTNLTVLIVVLILEICVDGSVGIDRTMCWIIIYF